MTHEAADFITLVGGAAAVLPRAARAQQTGKVRAIGFHRLQPVVNGPWAAGFVQRLGELGWIEGHTLAIEYRWAEGSSDRAAEFAAEFVQLKVDVIVTYANPMRPRRKARDLAHPDHIRRGGRPARYRPRREPGTTGRQRHRSVNPGTDLAGKRLELLRDVVPGLRRLAIMVNVSNPASVRDMGEVQAAARILGIEVATFKIEREEDITPAIEEQKGRAEALYVCIDTLLFSKRILINTLAIAARLPTMLSNQEYVEAGGLMSYQANFSDLFRRAGDYLDKILRGVKAGDLPVEQPTKFDLIINLKTAKALGLTIPPSLLAITDEVIE